MNKNRLQALMKLHGDTGQTLADHLGISRSTLSAKINETNGAEFTQSEIGQIKELYGLAAEDIIDIFFNEKVS